LQCRPAIKPDTDGWPVSLGHARDRLAGESRCNIVGHLTQVVERGVAIEQRIFFATNAGRRIRASVLCQDFANRRDYLVTRVVAEPVIYLLEIIDRGTENGWATLPALEGRSRRTLEAAPVQQASKMIFFGGALQLADDLVDQGKDEHACDQYGHER